MIGALEVVRSDTQPDLVRATCAGCGRGLAYARTGVGAVDVVGSQLDKVGAVLICGECVAIVAGAVRNPLDPHQHDAAAQLLTSALGCSTEARHRAADPR